MVDGSRRDGAGKTVAIIGSRGYPSYYGGYETIVRRVAPFLADAGWDVVVYGRDGATEPQDPQKDPRIITKVSRGFETKSLSTLSYGLSATLDAAVAKPDVALVMNVANGFWLPALRARGIPALVHVDGIEWERAKWGTAAKRLFRLGATVTAKLADELVYDSLVIQERYQEMFGVGVGTTIYHGGDVPAEIRPVEDGLRRRGYILSVARFVPENTINEFLDVVERLAPTTDIVLVGSAGYGGPLDERAAQLAAAFPRFRWLGHVADDERLQGLWQNAGAYFHGHSVGGTNPSLVQAMACGAPIVSRDTGYNREVLGEFGDYVQPDVDRIASALESLLQDEEKQERFSAGGVRRALDINKWEDIGGHYVELLERFRKR